MNIRIALVSGIIAMKITVKTTHQHHLHQAITLHEAGENLHGREHTAIIEEIEEIVPVQRVDAVPGFSVVGDRGAKCAVLAVA